MDNPDTDAPNVIGDLLIEEAWLASQDSRHGTGPDTAERYRERLRRVRGDLDRCAELLSGRDSFHPTETGHPADPAPVRRQLHTRL